MSLSLHRLNTIEKNHLICKANSITGFQTIHKNQENMKFNENIGSKQSKAKTKKNVNESAKLQISLT